MYGCELVAADAAYTSSNVLLWNLMWLLFSATPRAAHLHVVVA